MRHVGCKRLFKGSEILASNQNFVRACEQLLQESPLDPTIRRSVETLLPFFRLNLGFFLPGDKYLLTMVEAESIFAAPARSCEDALGHLRSAIAKISKGTATEESFLGRLTGVDAPTTLN